MQGDYIAAACTYVHKWSNPGGTMELFHHVTHTKIECGLQEKPAINCNECLPCQTAEIYMRYFVELVSVYSGYK